MKSKRIDTMARCLAIGLVILVSFISKPALAGSFSARISPPNFELKAKPGEVLRRVISITNADDETARYQVRTADWRLNEQGGVIITPADQPLASGSCRPWTRIESRSLRLLPGATKRYRFEVHVPEDASDGECRFAVVVSPAPDSMDSMTFGPIRFPISGSIAVIVYVTVGKAMPNLEFNGIHKTIKNNIAVPVIRFTNTGNAHARPFGSVWVEDAAGNTAELIAVSFPILPARTWDVELVADPDRSGIASMSELKYPLNLKGLIEWDGGTCEVKETVR